MSGTISYQGDLLIEKDEDGKLRLVPSEVTVESVAAQVEELTRNRDALTQRIIELQELLKD